jgi:GTP-binding protein
MVGKDKGRPEAEAQGADPRKADGQETDAAAIEAGRRLFAKECRFVTSAADPGGIPEAGLPEVAFAGRSNVGKSSLLNALTGRRALARTSNVPGRTRLLNFFSLGARLMLVDLPGYGYARASHRQVAAWTALIDAYLLDRAALRRVCLLIDARHGPTAADREMMARLDAAAVPYQAVLTKADKVKAAELAALCAALARELARHPAAHPEIAVTSARDKTGIAELRAGLARLAG